MEAAELLAERLMSQYEGRLPLKLIHDAIFVVLRDGGLRIGDSVPPDLVIEAEERLAALSAGTTGAQHHAPALVD